MANLTREAFTFKLDALIQEGKARILSRPRLSCQSGKEAKLVVGGEVPVLSGTTTPSSTTPGAVGATTGASVEYKEYGVILNIKPRLEESGRIHVNLDVVVSEVGETVSTSYALAYTMTKRTATTELFLNDGQTMALGGLIKKRSSEDLKRMPWLSDIPVLGLFFRQRTNKEGWKSDTDKINDTELFITLTPHLVSQNEKPQNELKPGQQNINIPSVGDDQIKDPVLKYSKLAQKRILDNLVYPQEAKEAGFQGAVKLSLKLSPQGDLLDAKVKESSSYRILDDAALKIAQETSPYPPFPAEIKEKELWVDIPIVYQLE
jgi:TonB family protein